LKNLRNRSPFGAVVVALRCFNQGIIIEGVMNKLLSIRLLTLHDSGFPCRHFGSGIHQTGLTFSNRSWMRRTTTPKISGLRPISALILCHEPERRVAPSSFYNTRRPKPRMISLSTQPNLSEARSGEPRDKVPDACRRAEKNQGNPHCSRPVQRGDLER
jgi:hypothetical protein